MKHNYIDVFWSYPLLHLAVLRKKGVSRLGKWSFDLVLICLTFCFLYLDNHNILAFNWLDAFLMTVIPVKRLGCLNLLCAVFIFTVVMGERCHQANDCSVTPCSSGSSMACIHDECTCTTQSGNGKINLNYLKLYTVLINIEVIISYIFIRSLKINDWWNLKVFVLIFLFPE